MYPGCARGPRRSRYVLKFEELLAHDNYCRKRRAASLVACPDTVPGGGERKPRLVRTIVAIAGLWRAHLGVEGRCRVLIDLVVRRSRDWLPAYSRVIGATANIKLVPSDIARGGGWIYLPRGLGNAASCVRGVRTAAGTAGLRRVEERGVWTEATIVEVGAANVVGEIHPLPGPRFTTPP